VPNLIRTRFPGILKLGAKTTQANGYSCVQPRYKTVSGRGENRAESPADLPIVGDVRIGEHPG
jgi:hypothetical protein